MDGHSLWKENTGKKNASCASCHGDSGQKMVGVATQFPKVQKGKLQPLERQINQYRASKQEAQVLAYESKQLLALTAFVATQSKGMPIAIEETPQNKKDLQDGRQIFNERMGQLNLSLCLMPPRLCWIEAGGESHSPGAPNRLSNLPNRMADDGIITKMSA